MGAIIVIVILFYFLAYVVMSFAKQKVLQHLAKTIRKDYELVSEEIYTETSKYVVYREIIDEETEVLYYIYYSLVDFSLPFAGYLFPVKKISKIIFTGNLEINKKAFKIKTCELSVFNFKTFLTHHE